MNPFASNQLPPSDPAVNILGFSVGLGSFLIFIGVVILIFLICREIVCWYWKINERVDLLKDIRQELHSIHTTLKRTAPKEEVRADTVEQ